MEPFWYDFLYFNIAGINRDKDEDSTHSEEEEGNANVKVLTPEQERDRKRILICVLIALCSIQMFFLNVESIIPVYVEHHHETLNETHSSIIMT